MDRSYRRLVTGNNASGRSILVEDAEIKETGSAGNFNFWRTRAWDSADVPAGPLPFFPAAGVSGFRFPVPAGESAVG